MEEQHISVAGPLQIKLITPSTQQITAAPRLGRRPGNVMECVSVHGVSPSKPKQLPVLEQSWSRSKFMA